MDIEEIFTLTPESFDTMSEEDLLLANETMRTYIEESQNLLSAVSKHVLAAKNIQKLNGSDLQFAQDSAEKVNNDLNALASGDNDLQAFVENLNLQVDKIRLKQKDIPNSIQCSPIIGELRDLASLAEQVNTELDNEIDAKRAEITALERRKTELLAAQAAKRVEKSQPTVEDTPSQEPTVKTAAAKRVEQPPPNVEDVPMQEPPAEAAKHVEQPPPPTVEDAPAQEPPVKAAAKRVEQPPTVEKAPAQQEPTTEDAPMQEPTAEDEPLQEPTIEDSPVQEPNIEDEPVQESPLIEHAIEQETLIEETVDYDPLDDIDFC